VGYFEVILYIRSSLDTSFVGYMNW